MIRFQRGEGTCTICGVSKGNSISPFFKIPPDENRRKLWLDALGLSSSYSSPYKEIHLLGPQVSQSESISILSEKDFARFSACGRHFLPSMFTRIEEFGNQRRTNLKKEAVPILVKTEDWNRMFELTSSMVIDQQQLDEAMDVNKAKPSCSTAPPMVGLTNFSDHFYEQWIYYKPIPIRQPEVDTKSPTRSVQPGLTSHSTAGSAWTAQSTSESAVSKRTSASGTVSDEDENGDDDVLDSDRQNDPQATYSVDWSNLAELFSVCRTPGCGKPVVSENILTSHSDGRLTIHWKCSDHSGEWSSSVFFI